MKVNCDTDKIEKPVRGRCDTDAKTIGMPVLGSKLAEQKKMGRLKRVRFVGVIFPFLVWVRRRVVA